MFRHRNRRVPVLAAAAACALTGGFLFGPAWADSQPVDPSDPKTPVTVASDPLPTAQHNGVAWQQVIVGNTVYVAGSFSTARPAGAAAGSQTVTRNNILAFNLTTGALISGFAPSLNGQARAITASPDGSRIYVGGDFTRVNGTIDRSRIAALDPATGAVISSFNPRVGGSVRALAATNSTVYIGGTFTSVGSTSRNRLAAVNASNGALLSWTPNANDRVNALVVSPDGSQVVIGGAFTTLNGSNRPGYGLARVNATTGASLSLQANDVVRNAGTDSAILSLSSDGTQFYGSGYIFGTGGNLEGAFAANWSDGRIKWVEDCHGDTYGVFASPTAVYVAGHPHYCGNLGGYPETSPRTWHRGLAFSRAATRTLTRDIHGYPSFTGQPGPELLNWFPDLDTGTASGQSQGPWAVAGNADYVVMVGEFRNVNQKPQQGLVRFAVRSIAANNDGPRVSAANANPTLTYQSAGQVRVRWTANWDRDNENLTYQVIRDGNTANPVHTVSRLSRFYNRPTLEFTDTGLSQGTHTYRIIARDPFGNAAQSNVVSVNVTTGGTPAENAAPTASFTASTSGLGVSVNGSGSTDSDGTISSYAWNFGDNATASGATASHTYAAAGTYTVRLTVTDNDGATNSTTRSVTVGDTPPPAGQLATDAFGRTLASGLGSADVGGAWSLNGSASYFAVNGGQGKIIMGRAGLGPSAYLGGVSSTNSDTTVKFSLDKLANGSGADIRLDGRVTGNGANVYGVRIKIAANGAMTQQLVRFTAADTVLATRSVGATYAAGQEYLLRIQVTGTNPTTISSKIWRSGTTEPAGWQQTATDSTAALQSAGGVGIKSYLSGSSTNFPLTASFDDLAAVEAN